MSNFMTAVAPSQPTMSSREIAELLCVRHTDVCRTIERLMAKGAIGRYAPMAYTHPQNGQDYTEYLVGKRDSYVIVAQLSPEFTARLVDRWQELELAQPQPAAIDYSDPRVMLGLVSHLQGQVGAAEAQLAEQAPRIEAMDLMEGAVGWMCLTDAAKALKQKPQPFMNWLSNGMAWTYRRCGKGAWVAMQTKLDAGLMGTTPHTHRDRYGVDHVSHQAMVTPKGLAKLAEVIAALPGQKVPD